MVKREDAALPMGFQGYGPIDNGMPQDYEVDTSVSFSNFEPGMGMSLNSNLHVKNK